MTDPFVSGFVMDEAAAMETPSGKSAADENFPVGSWLLRARVRPHVAAFYAYARAIDDIADNPRLTPDDKIERLDGFAKAVSGGGGETDPAISTTCPPAARPVEAFGGAVLIHVEGHCG